MLVRVGRVVTVRRAVVLEAEVIEAVVLVAVTGAVVAAAPAPEVTKLTETSF